MEALAGPRDAPGRSPATGEGGLYGRWVGVVDGLAAGRSAADPPPGVAAGLGPGRTLSRLAGLLSVAVLTLWVHRVLAAGRPGRWGALLTGADPGPREAGSGPGAAGPGAALALLGAGLCLPLVQEATVYGPASVSGAALLAAAALGWHAAAGPRGRRLGGLSLALALACGLLAWGLRPAAAAAVIGVAAWALAAGALRLRAEPDPHRRPREAVGAALALLALGVLAAPLAAAGVLPDAAAFSPGWATPAEPAAALAGSLGLLTERLGWVAWASPLALGVTLWARPAAGSLLLLLAGCTLGGCVLLPEPTEADLLPVFFALVAAWAVAGGIAVRLLSPVLRVFFQALAERVGVYRHAAAVGSAAAAIALAGLTGWAAWRSPGYHLTGRVLAEGPGEGPYGRTDWDRAAGPLRAALPPGGVVAAWAPAAARFHLGRADALLAGSGPASDPDAAPIVHDRATGLPVVRSAGGVRSLLRERPFGLIVADRDAWRVDGGVPDAAADAIERGASRVPLPARSGLYAFRWGPAPAP